MDIEVLLRFSCRENRTSLPAKTRPAIGSSLQTWQLLSSNHIPPWFFWSSLSLFPVLVFRGKLFYLSTFLPTGQPSTKYICVVDCASTWSILYIYKWYWICCVVFFFVFFSIVLDGLFAHLPLRPSPPCTALPPPTIVAGYVLTIHLVEGTCSDATFVNFSKN